MTTMARPGRPASEGDEDRDQRLSRALYEIGALWQRVRRLDRGKADTDHDHAMDGVSARAARVYLGSSQSISNTTWTKVAVDSVTDDPDSLFDSANSQIGADKAGWWLVSIGVGFDGSTSGARRQVAVSRNGSRVARSSARPVSSSDLVVTVADVMLVSSGDTFEAQAWQDSGGSLDLMPQGGERTWLSAAYLGSA